MTLIGSGLCLHQVLKRLLFCLTLNRYWMVRAASRLLSVVAKCVNGIASTPMTSPAAMASILYAMCGHRAAGTHTQAEIMPRSSEIVRFFAHLFIYNKPFQCCRMSQLAALGSKFAAVTCISQGASWFVRGGRAQGGQTRGGGAPVVDHLYV